MKKWYYTWHAHNGSLSLFETSEYNGRGGYESKEAAIKSARSMLTRDQRELSLSAMARSNELASIASRLDEISRALLKLDKE